MLWLRTAYSTRRVEAIELPLLGDGLCGVDMHGSM